MGDENTFLLTNNFPTIESLDLSTDGKAKLLDLIQSQYRLFHLIARTKTAYVAIMDGVTSKYKGIV